MTIQLLLAGLQYALLLAIVPALAEGLQQQLPEILGVLLTMAIGASGALVGVFAFVVALVRFVQRTASPWLADDTGARA